MYNFNKSTRLLYFHEKMLNCNKYKCKRVQIYFDSWAFLVNSNYQ